MLDLQKLEDRKRWLHINYDELCERSGVSWATTQQIVSGRNTNPLLNTLEAIVEALGGRIEVVWND